MSSASYNLLEAVNLALHRAMQEDPDVVVLGEDIATNGGVFRATDGLLTQFGERRVIDTPLAETMIAGLSVGMACQQLKPVAELQFMGFIFPALEQLICQAARMRNRTRGRLSCPLVVRAPFGGGIHAPEHHSESTEALFAQIPGLRVVIPSSPKRAYGLLLAAIDNPDPVIFLEPKRIYRSTPQPLEDDSQRLPLDRCYTLREGSDVTLISWGAMIQETLQAADAMAELDVSCEVIDLVCASPIDRQTLLASVAKTGRCVIAHEAPLSCAVGAEIAATLACEGLMHLHAPVQRITGYDTVMPYLRLESHYLPDVAAIKQAISQTMEYA